MSESVTSASSVASPSALQAAGLQSLAATMGVTFGALLLGTFIGLVLFGLTVYQTFRYLQMYPTDVQRLKATVVAMFIIDTLHSALCMHLCYYYLIDGRVDSTLLESGVWSLRLLTPTTGSIVLIVQGFYARRLYVVNSKFKVFVAIAVALMLCELASHLVLLVESFKIPEFARWGNYSWLCAVPYGFSLAIDVILTTSLIVVLNRSRTGIRRYNASRSPFTCHLLRGIPSTDSLLDVLIVYTINTGLLTSTLSVLGVVLAAAQPHNLIYIALNMPITKCYVNSMLAVLNSRRGLFERSRDMGNLGTFGMTVPSITTANVALDRLQVSLRVTRDPVEGRRINPELAASSSYVLGNAEKTTHGGDSLSSRDRDPCAV